MELYVQANEAPEEELFRHGVSSGDISRYENTEVSMTGSDVLAKVNSFEEANLHSLVMRNIRKSNYSRPTPVQKHAIPNIKERALGNANTLILPSVSDPDPELEFRIRIRNKIID